MIITNCIKYLSFQILGYYRILQHKIYSFLSLVVLVKSEFSMGHHNILFVFITIMLIRWDRLPLPVLNLLFQFLIYKFYTFTFQYSALPPWNVNKDLPSTSICSKWRRNQRILRSLLINNILLLSSSHPRPSNLVCSSLFLK